MITQGPVINGWSPVSVVIFLCVYSSLPLVNLLFCFSLHPLLTWALTLQPCRNVLGPWWSKVAPFIAVGFEISAAFIPFTAWLKSCTVSSSG